MTRPSTPAADISIAQANPMDILGTTYIHGAAAMQVSKWGNSLAVRLPASVVKALELREGDHIELHALGTGNMAVSRKRGARELLARIRRFRGALPADFHFDRLEANARK
jgi:antitoxin MazE